jgi:hypothetical protein
MAGDGTKANIQDVGDVSVTLTCGQAASRVRQEAPSEGTG